MPVRLNHTIVHARDKQEAAAFFSDILGLPAPVPSGHSSPCSALTTSPWISPTTCPQ